MSHRSITGQSSVTFSLVKPSHDRSRWLTSETGQHPIPNPSDSENQRVNVGYYPSFIPVTTAATISWYYPTPANLDTTTKLDPQSRTYVIGNDPDLKGSVHHGHPAGNVPDSAGSVTAAQLAPLEEGLDL
jgi:hypothetical protein